MVNGYAAKSLREALEIRAAQEVVPYAGGTDLMVENRPGVTYLFLNKVPELKEIRADGEYVRIGGGVSFTQALGSPLVPPLMKEAVSRIAAPAIRNAGTFAGNIGNGSAKADSVLIAFAADAKVRVVSLRGERVVDIDRFYLGRKKLDIHSDELIAELLLPGEGLENYYYEKVGGRNALAISRVAFAGILRMDSGKILSLAAAFGAVADVVLRYKDLEAMMTGKTLSEARAIKEEFLKAYDERMVLTTGRVSAEYRKTVCQNLLSDFLTQKGI
jgi:CO/xanthine dehydrogenase FAD-binding subunit